MIANLDELIVILGPSLKYMQNHQDSDYAKQRASDAQLDEKEYIKVVESKFKKYNIE